MQVHYYYGSTGTSCFFNTAVYRVTLGLRTPTSNFFESKFNLGGRSYTNSFDRYTRIVNNRNATSQTIKGMSQKWREQIA